MPENQHTNITPTKKQKILLDFVDAFVENHGFSPTLREIMHALGYKSVSTVAKHVDNLIARGWLVKRDGEARSLEVASLDSGSMSAAGTSVSDEAHRQWAERRFRELLRDESVVAEDKAALERAWELLGLGEDEASA